MPAHTRLDPTRAAAPPACDRARRFRPASRARFQHARYAMRIFGSRNSNDVGRRHRGANAVTLSGADSSKSGLNGAKIFQPIEQMPSLKAPESRAEEVLQQCGVGGAWRGGSLKSPERYALLDRDGYFLPSLFFHRRSRARRVFKVRFRRDLVRRFSAGYRQSLRVRGPTAPVPKLDPNRDAPCTACRRETAQLPPSGFAPPCR